MNTIVPLVKSYLIPGSTPFLVLMLLVVVVLLFLNDRTRRWGRYWLLAVTVLYWVLCAPLGSALLEAGLSGGIEPLESGAEARAAEAIVVLGGGSVNLRARGEVLSIITGASALRALEAARLYRLMEDPLVIASGGRNESMEDGIPESELLSDVLAEAGVPADRVVQESLSTSTREQAIELRRILRARGIGTFVLVTSPIHMPRSLKVFHVLGMDPIPGPSPLRSEGMFPNRYGLLPSELAQDASVEAVREYMATVYYWLRGWTRAAAD
jgi:uncharacterized SAM-binding protein YcdF (DUF218 family)